MVIAQQELREGVARILHHQHIAADYADDPYAAMGELSRRPLVYRTVVLSLQGIYHEELKILPAIKRRYPHIEVYLAHTDGRHGAMAEAMRLGADGIVSEDGIHRTATSPAPVQRQTVIPPPATSIVESPAKLDLSNSEPLLTADELRALLEDEPAYPPAVGGEK